MDKCDPVDVDKLMAVHFKKVDTPIDGQKISKVMNIGDDSNNDEPTMDKHIAGSQECDGSMNKIKNAGGINNCPLTHSHTMQPCTWAEVASE